VIIRRINLCARFIIRSSDSPPRFYSTSPAGCDVSPPSRSLFRRREGLIMESRYRFRRSV
jgi:hypothetical protein